MRYHSAALRKWTQKRNNIFAKRFVVISTLHDDDRRQIQRRDPLSEFSNSLDADSYLSEWIVGIDVHSRRDDQVPGCKFAEEMQRLVQRRQVARVIRAFFQGKV